MSNASSTNLHYEMSELNALGAQHTAIEIAQQLQLWPDLTAHFTKVDAHIQQFLQPLLNDPALTIIFTGAGTSAFIGEAIAPFLRSQTGLDIHTVPSTDLVSNPTLYLKRATPTLLVSFARSGNSPESVAAVQILDQLVDQSYHLFITCNPQGQLAISAKGQAQRLCVLMPSATNDQSFAMTSSYSCMYLCALHCFEQCSSEIKNQQRSDLSDFCQSLITPYIERSKILAVAPPQRLVFLGSGGLQGNAKEAALKCMELTAGQLIATHDSSLGFRHGPKFIVNQHTLVVVLRSNDAYTQQYDDDIIAELRSDGVADVLVLSSEAIDSDIGQLTHNNSNLADVYQGLAWVMFSQIFGFHLAISLGLSPDNPCPSGEVNRVVQGVTIHPVTNHHD